MLCPIDQTELNIAERQGIEIDYCPKCRGVWLDRGELDKLIERSALVATRYDDDDDDWDDRRRPEGYRPDERGYERERGGYPGQPYPKRKRRSFLGELFDID